MKKDAMKLMRWANTIVVTFPNLTIIIVVKKSDKLSSKA